MSDTLLRELLDQRRADAPEYRGGLSNHLPMALLALQRLGAGEDRLRAFAARYARRLEPMQPSARPVPSFADWPRCLSDLAAYGALRDLFDEALQRDGAAAVLHIVLPKLMPGIGAAAFHGLIRTAYGLDGAHAAELAAGLAYWACRYLPLSVSLGAEAERDLPQWIDRMAAIRREHEPPSSGLIFERMQRVASVDAFARDAASLKVGPQTLRHLSAFAAQRYLASRDFTVLHLMTSCHALRVLLPHVDDAMPALRWYAVAFAAGLVASGVDADRPAPAVEPLPWPDIAELACRSDDEHVIKLAYTCRAQCEAYDDDRYRQVATLAVSG